MPVPFDLLLPSKIGHSPQKIDELTVNQLIEFQLYEIIITYLGTIYCTLLFI